MAVVTIALLTVLGPAIFPSGYAVATWSANPAAGVLTGPTGLLRAQTNPDGTACFWLAGDGGDRNALVWPQGYSAHGSPLSIFDQNGNLIGTDGYVITLGGATAHQDVAAKGIVGCPPTRFVTFVNQWPP
jgi:hypothetical protein